MRDQQAVRVERSLNSFDSRYVLGQQHVAVNGRLEPSDFHSFHWFLWVLGVSDEQLARVHSFDDLGGWRLAALTWWLEHPAAYLGTHPGGAKRHADRLEKLRHPFASDISAHGVSFIAGFEGFEPNWRDDGFGNPTVGYGHTKPDGDIHTPLTKRAALELLHHDLAGYVASVLERIHRPLKQNELDALVSFVYNLGPGPLDDHIADDINHGRLALARGRMLEYDHANGARVYGLTRRRQAEVALFQRA